MQPSSNTSLAYVTKWVGLFSNAGFEVENLNHMRSDAESESVS